MVSCQHRKLLAALGFATLILFMGLMATGAQAGPLAASTQTPTATPMSTPTAKPLPVTPPVSVDVDPHSNCLMCHSNPEFAGVFENGEEISLFVA